MKTYKKITAKILVFGVIWLWGVSGGCFEMSQPGISSAVIWDISDREYEPVVIELLDNAEESIVMAMYIVRAEGKGPVRRLLKDLEEALERGVSVKMYLNTRFKSNSAPWVIQGEVFDTLREKGAEIFSVTHTRLLHDKLIIVDGRYVVVGSTNWSVAALKDNYESSVLVDSPEYAAKKLARVKWLTLDGEWAEQVEKAKDPERLVLFSEGDVVVLDKKLLEDERFFPHMVTERDRRAMDTYLLLKAYAVRMGSREFFVSLESLALELDIPVEWNNTDKRRQVIKVLKKLEERYGLIDVDFGHWKDALVKIPEVSGDTFEVKGSFFKEEVFSGLSTPAKFVVLVKALFEEEGSSIDSFTFREMSERFHISDMTISKGSKEIDR